VNHLVLSNVRRFLIVSASVGVLAAAALAAYAIVTVTSSSPYTPGKPQIRFTVTDGCPARLARFGDVRPDGPGLGSALVPDQTPSAGLICTYRPLPRYAAAQHGSVRLPAATARMLSAALARVELTGPPGEVACPAATGRFAVIVLSYPGRPDVDVRYLDSGCQTLDNGVVQAWEVTNPSFYEGFETAYARVLHNG
jgi:hypothetical protein